jgi:hypothetical protein
MTDRYDDVRVAPDPVLAEALRRRLHARMAGGASETETEPESAFVPVKEIDVALDTPTNDKKSGRRIAMVAAAVIVVAGATGIAIRGGGTDDDSPSPATEPTIESTVAPTAAPTTNAPTTEVPTTEPVDAMRQVQILGGPDWLAADDEGVWVKLDIGELHLVDPQTVTVIAEVELGGPSQPPCQGLGFGFGSVWTCAGTDVVRVDPVTRTVQSRLPINKVSAQGHLVAYADRMWVLTGTGDTLVGIDPATEQIVTTITLPWRASELGAGAAGLWAISASDGHVIRVDVEAGAVTLDVAVADAVSIAVGDQVWLGAKLQSVQLDPATGAVVTTIDAGLGSEGSIISDGQSVWVRNPSEFLARFDAATGDLIQTYSPDVSSGGDMLLAFGSVWTTAFDNSTLFEVPID